MKRTIAQCLALMLVAGFTVQTATAMTVAEEMGWYEYATNPYDTGGSPDGGGTACGDGTRTFCMEKTHTVCNAYVGKGTVLDPRICRDEMKITTKYFYP